jgi:DNA-binding NarL/FixJ family response regulator
MVKKSIYVCVNKDLTNPISWALREFESQVTVRYFDHTKQLGIALKDDEGNSVIILDSNIGQESSLPFAAALKAEKPSFKILLVLSDGTTKEEVVKVIQSKVVSGVLMRPFTAEQLSDNIYKLCGFQKPSEVPWYMKT